MFLLRLVLCCCDIIFRFRLHQAGVQLGGMACWIKVMQVLPGKVICDRSGETHVSRYSATRRRPIKYYMPVVLTGMNIIEFLASTVLPYIGNSVGPATRERRQGVKASRFHIRSQGPGIQQLGATVLLSFQRRRRDTPAVVILSNNRLGADLS